MRDSSRGSRVTIATVLRYQGDASGHHRGHAGSVQRGLGAPTGERPVRAEGSRGADPGRFTSSTSPRTVERAHPAPVADRPAHHRRERGEDPRAHRPDPRVESDYRLGVIGPREAEREISLKLRRPHGLRPLALLRGAPARSARRRHQGPVEGPPRAVVRKSRSTAPPEVMARWEKDQLRRAARRTIQTQSGR